MVGFVVPFSGRNRVFSVELLRTDQITGVRNVQIWCRFRRHAQMQLYTTMAQTHGNDSNKGNDGNNKGAYRLAVIGIVGLLCFELSTSATHAEIISSPECFNGTGPGCAGAGEGNKLIEKLLEKSRANKERMEEELRNKYWKEGYGSYFSFGFNKELKQGSDGTWSLEQPDDFVSKFAQRFKKSDNGAK